MVATIISAQVKPTGRPSGRAWAPGVSGNPSGRPKVYANAVARCRDYIENGDGWRRVLALAASDDERVSWAVLETLLAYAYGKPLQALSNPDGSPLELGARVLVLTQEYGLDDLRVLLAEIKGRKALAAPATVKSPEPGQ